MVSELDAWKAAAIFGLLTAIIILFLSQTSLQDAAKYQSYKVDISELSNHSWMLVDSSYVCYPSNRLVGSSLNTTYNFSGG